MIPITDISKWQGRTDFNVMASRGVQGVIIRAGNGKTGDPAISTYMPAAKAAGLKTGVYFFVNPKVSDGATQGRLLAEAHNRWECDIPPMLDVENYLNEPGPDILVVKGPAFAAWLREMAETCEAESRKPIIYTNRAYWDPWISDASFGHYDLIVARYPWYSPSSAAANVPPTDASKWGEWLFSRTTKRPQVPTGWDDYDAWQFSAGFNKQGPVYGCSSSDLDLNIVKPDVWERWIGRPPVIGPPVVEPEKPVERPPTIEPVPEPAEGDDMTIFYTNSDDHQGFGPRKWQYALIHDGVEFTKYHITNGAVAALDMPDKGFKFYERTSDELKSIPDFEGMKYGPAQVPVFGPMSVVFSGTGTARPV